jgi:hypothetical protein
LILGAVTAMMLAGCQGTGTSSAKVSSAPTASSTAATSSAPAASSVVASSSAATQTAVEKAIADAEGLTQEQLFEKAAKELGQGKLKILATTSRGGKDAVKNAFIAKLQKYDSTITDPLAYDTTVDGTIYTTLTTEISTGVTDGYSAAIVQDGYQLQKKGLDTKYFKNYIPKEWKEASDVDMAASDPFTLQYNFKTWMYNNKSGNTKIDNVWDITASSFKGKIDTMNPNNENVNMDWLIQLTDPDQVAKLKTAYDAASNSSDIKIADYSEYGDKAYAYAFIDGFIRNAVFYEDDGKAVANLAKADGNVGWIVYSKLLKVAESADVSKKNLVVAALGTDNTNGATMGDSKIAGFGGFMYKHYLQVMPNAKYPYASCAFFNLISTNAAAYKVWGADVGDYPSLPSINVDRTQFGNGTLGADYVFTQKAGDPTVFPCLNDPTSNWWLNKGGAVVETPSFIGANYETVIGFIDECIAAK